MSDAAIGGTWQTIAVVGSPSVMAPETFWVGMSQINVPLDPIGATGCKLQTEFFVILGTPGVQDGRSGFEIPVPRDPFLPGSSLNLQAMFFPDTGANPFSLALANGLHIV